MGAPLVECAQTKRLSDQECIKPSVSMCSFTVNYYHCCYFTVVISAFYSFKSFSLPVLPCFGGGGVSSDLSSMSCI